MMRALLLASAALVATPAAAQDHSAHGQVDHSQHQPVVEEDHSTHEAAPAEDHSAHQHTDHSQHQGMDHGPMDHSQHDSMDHGEMDHSQHEGMDHGAMDHSQMDHSGHAMGMDIPSGPPPARAFEGPQHAADEIFDPRRMAQARAYNHASHGSMATGSVLTERLEARVGEGHDEYLWDVTAWYGTATDKIVFKSEGEGEFGGGLEEVEGQLLWGHAIGPFVDLQVGMRVDAEPDTLAHGVIGVAGLAPLNIHFDAAVFVSSEGDFTARIEAEHDMKLTQQLILQPRVELELAAQDIPERETGSGAPEVAVGARLRYEIVPEFAPYIGVEYTAATGRTADVIRAAGDDPDGVAFTAGLRFWF
ncbi:copper resistance protein B [Aurantiacibacter sp. MUD11]|uniref:copper resistance protein B n=1 Tax=Aurantiacibacter sp. MUD11 TaxID=3003265 RepID=UPI0022AA649D|nr:copper resistance protein B [Aurantiacibacter sp. MUD11]WAT17385.1 copper resistance protein B [Aurantiacibacter sp. MUD11]